MFTLQTIIPEIIIILSLAGIIFIVAKKFPQVAKVKVVKKEKKPSLFNQAVKGIINFSVNIIKGLIRQTAKIKNLKKESYQQPAKEEIKKSIFKKSVKAIAKPIFKPIAKIQTKSPISLRAKAELLVGKKEYKEAEKVYLELIKKDGKDIDAYKGLGKIYFIQKILTDAQTAYEQVVKLDPNDLEAQTEIFKIRNLKKDLSVKNSKS